MSDKAAVGFGSDQGKKSLYSIVKELFFKEEMAQKIPQILRWFSLDMTLG